VIRPARSGSDPRPAASGALERRDLDRALAREEVVADQLAAVGDERLEGGQRRMEARGGNGGVLLLVGNSADPSRRARLS
jgi:hypothetical protein